MFLPFIYDFSPTKEASQLWAFFSFLSMQKKINGPIIAPKAFFNPKTWVKNGRQEAVNQAWAEYNCYDLPQQEDLQKIQPIAFPDEILQTLATEETSFTSAAARLHREIYEPLVQWLEDTIKSLKEKGCNVQAVIVLGELPSVKEACQRCGITSLYFEWGPLRPALYQRTAYLDRLGVISPSEIAQKYEQFQQVQDKVPILEKKALLALLLKDEFCSCVQYLDAEPEYEMGVCAQEEGNFRNLAFGYFTNADLIAQAKEVYADCDILFRDRPSAPLPVAAQGIEKDCSMTPAQFVCRCKRVASISSNMAFEAMLWGKPSYIVGPMPYKIKAESNLKNKDAEAVDDAFLNFAVFAFLIPYQKLLDVEYLEWRLKNPPIEDIYLSNLKYYCNIQNLNFDTLSASGFLAEDILKEKGYEPNGQPLGIVGKEAGCLRPEWNTKKILVQQQENQQTILFCVEKDGRFTVSVPVKKAGKTTLSILMPAGAKISIDDAVVGEQKVKITAVNCEKDGVSFCKENPTFEFDNDTDSAILTIQGNLQEINPFELAINRMFEEQNQNWELSEQLKQKQSEWQQLSQQNQQLREYSQKQETDILEKNQWQQKLEADILLKNELQQKLELEVEAKQNEVQQLQSQLNEVQAYLQKLEKDKQALKKYITTHPLKTCARVICKKDFV